MSTTEVTDQDQPQEQAEKQPSEAATENGDSSSKPKVDGEEVKSKPDAKEEQTVAASEASEQVGIEPTTCSPLEEKIIRQVEFYFGDRNLPRDKFLQQAVASDDDGWVPLSTLLTFNRLKALSSDAELIANALKKTKNDIIEVNDAGTHVRRNPHNPAPDIFSLEERKKIKEKTVYVKGFSEDLKLDDLQTFFGQYGKTEYIRMRRTSPPEKKFKGSVFVEFTEKPMAERFLGLPTIKFNDTELIKESKEAYFTRKQHERKQAKEEQKSVEPAADIEKEKAKQKEEEAEAESVVKKHGCILFFKGCGDKTTREDIKEIMREFATVKYIDFRQGQTEGYVRLDEEQGAQKVLEGMAADGAKPEICGTETELKVLEGEEEEQYWQKVVEGGKNKAKAKGMGRRDRKFGRPGRGGYGGRKRRQKSSASEDVDGEGGASPPVAKQPKSEDKEE